MKIEFEKALVNPNITLMNEENVLDIIMTTDNLKMFNKSMKLINPKVISVSGTDLIIDLNFS